MSHRYSGSSSLGSMYSGHSHSGHALDGHSHSHDGHSLTDSQHGGSTSSLHNGGVPSSYGRAPGQRPNSFGSSGYESGYTSPGYVSPSPSGYLSPTFKYASSPSPSGLGSPIDWGGGGVPGSPGQLRIYDANPSPQEVTEYERSLEYHQAPDTFPCGHVLCHRCLRKFITTLGGLFGARCPVCRKGVSSDDVSLASVGLPSPGGRSAGAGSRWRQDEEPPISLLSNFDEIVQKFNGLQQNLRRLKDESVQSRSMGMTYTNTVCHLCREAHPTLRVIQEHNQLQVRHERPHAWSNYFYRLQQGKVVTTFYSKVNSSTICVPCTYRELTECRAILPPEVGEALPDIDPSRHQQLALAEVGKIVAKNSAPLLALRGKNVIEVDHKVLLRERADHFNFTETADQIERMVRQQEENLLRFASQQVRDTGQLYHVTESNEMEIDMDETQV